MVVANQIQVDDPVRGDYYLCRWGERPRGAVVVDEVPLAACLSGIDDDEDGATDYPFDPGCRPGMTVTKPILSRRPVV